MHSDTYNDKLHTILDAYDSVVTDSMHSAALEHIKSGHNAADIDASFHGTWQRRGHASLNGIVTANSQENGKCIDYQVETKTCRACIIWENKKHHKPEHYATFKETHVCRITHTGSAGYMEANGAVKMFRRSEMKNNLHRRWR